MAKVQTAVFHHLPIQPDLPHLDNSISVKLKFVNFQHTIKTIMKSKADIQL